MLSSEIFGAAWPDGPSLFQGLYFVWELENWHFRAHIEAHSKQMANPG
jgi:hypothetical protein